MPSGAAAPSPLHFPGSHSFEPTDEEARQWLDAAEGIHELDRISAVPNLTGVPVPVNADVVASLTDRWDGVALLAEAFAHQHPTGRLHELFRVLERAFALPVRKLGPALVTFLHPRFGYTTDEVDSWVNLRDPATHADVRRTFVLEAGVRPILRRLEQAAEDVLFNKAQWQDPYLNRRDVWRPTAWTKDEFGAGVAHLGTQGSPEAQLLDQFGAYPTDLTAALSHLPDGWWPAVDPRTDDLPFRVLPEGQFDE